MYDELCNVTLSAVCEMRQLQVIRKMNDGTDVLSSLAKTAAGSWQLLSCHLQNYILMTQHTGCYLLQTF